MVKKKAYVQVRRTLPSYTKLRGIAYRTHKLAEASEEGRLMNCTVSMLFSALCLEAFLNHLGEEIFDFWDEVERRLSPEDKLRFIARELSLELDFSSRPFQTFRDIFRYRNWIVHASTEQLMFEGEVILEEGERPPNPLSNWEQLISLQNASRFSKDSKAIIAALRGDTNSTEKPAFIGEIVQTSTQFTADSDNV